MFIPDYLQGDIHLGEHGMMKLVYNEFFDTIEEYEAEFIKRYNAKVKTNNKIVLFTGDLGRKDAIERVLPQLKGRKFLILGNHDNYSIAFYEKYFEEVFSTPVWTGKRVVVSHIPIPVEDGVLNIHSHTHWVKLKSNNHWNICPEWHNFTPILYKKVQGKLSKMSKPDYHFCKEWYKDIQEYHGKARRNDLVLKNDELTINAEKTLELRHLKTIAKIKGYYKDYKFDLVKFEEDYKDWIEEWTHTYDCYYSAVQEGVPYGFANDSGFKIEKELKRISNSTGIPINEIRKILLNNRKEAS